MAAERITSRLAFAATLAFCFIVGTPSAEALKPERVQTASPAEGPQVPVAQPGGRGEVLLLAGEPLSVRVLAGDLAIGEARPLGLAVPPGELRPLRAARDDLGDWLLAAGNRLHWIRGGDQRQLPTPPAALVWDVEFFGGAPVVAVTSVDAPGPGGIPLVFRWSGARWEPLVFEPSLADGPSGGAEAAVRRTQQTAAVLHAASDGTLWIGFVYRHRLLQVGSDGRTLREVQVGDDQRSPGLADPRLKPRLADPRLKPRLADPRLKPRLADPRLKPRLADPRLKPRLADPRLKPRLHEPVEEFPGQPAGRQATEAVNTDRRRLDGIAEGPAGAIYVLAVLSGHGPTHGLERFDPATADLVRAPLDLTEPGPVRMVASRRGLVLAADSAARGAWVLPWDSVAAAEWTATTDVTILPARLPAEP